MESAKAKKLKVGSPAGKSEGTQHGSGAGRENIHPNLGSSDIDSVVENGDLKPAAANTAASEGGRGASAVCGEGKKNRAKKGGEEEEGKEQEDDSDYWDAVDSVEFNSWVPSVKVGRSHPDTVVENAALAALRPPDVSSYNLKLPHSIVEAGLLSSLQLESVMLACARHNTIFPGGERAGMFIGDGAGVGKGRQLAGIVLENWLRGHKKHVWVSTSADLCLDAQRDLNDLKAPFIRVVNIADLPYKTIQHHEGVLFATYTSLASQAQKQGPRGPRGIKTRLDQIIKWLRDTNDDDGCCLLFDESHRAKNLLPSKNESSSKTALCVMKLQEALPRAKVVYCSATGLSEPRNLAYMTRLGLWGAGTHFRDFEALLSAVTSAGMGGLELAALQLKEMGPLSAAHCHSQVASSRWW